MSATKVQLTGGSFQDVAGNVLALGTLVLSLSQDGQVNSDAQIAAGYEITINLNSSGNVSTSPAQYVWPNDVITPANTFYNVSAYTAAGQLVWGPNAQQIFSTPSPFDIGAWVPAEVNTGTVDSSPFQRLTTTGTSGASTLTAGVLNIPVYAGGVTSVFTRTGAVVATTGDYAVAQVTGAAPIASPTFTGTVTGPTINATTGFKVGGTALASTNLSDTANLARLNATQTFTGVNTFSGDATFNGTACGFNNVGIAFGGTTQLLIQGSAAIRFDAVGTATSGANFASTSCEFYTSYWDSVHSAACNGEFIAIATPASGSNPVNTLGFSFYPNSSPPSGSGTGTGAYSFDGPITCSKLQTTQTPTASSTASNYSVPIVLNGTTYYVRLSSTA